MRLPSRKKFVLSAAMVFLVIAALATLHLVHSLRGPSTGKIETPHSGMTMAKTRASAQGFYNGRLISFTYPTAYKEARSSLSGSYLEVCHIYSSGHSGRNITLGVLRETLNDDSGVQYRRNHPELYQLQTSQASSQAFISRQNGFERTVFIEHAGLVLSIAAVDTNGYDMTADQNQIIKNLRWK